MPRRAAVPRVRQFSASYAEAIRHTEALFLIAGLMLNLFGHVDELRLYGSGRGHRVIGWLFVFGGLGLAGLPPTGTGLGKVVSEEAGSAARYWWGFIPATSGTTWPG